MYNMTTTLTIFGSAAGMPTSRRNCSGYLLSVDERSILFDCGSGITQEFLRNGCDPHNVDAIIISHMHPDHTSDLPYFIQTLKLEKKQSPLDLYLPDEAVNVIKSYLQTSYLLESRMPFALNIKSIDGIISLDSPKAEIHPIPNNHLKVVAGDIEKYGYPNKMQCHSFMIESENKRILYSADIESINDIKEHLNNLDLLIIESAHIDLHEMVKLIEVHDIKQTVFSHIPDAKEDEVRQMVDSYVGEKSLIMAEDGMVIDV